MKTVKTVIYKIIFVMSVAAYCAGFIVTPAYAQLDVPYIVYWEDGIPYDADDKAIVIWSGEEVWCIDETEEDETKAFVLLDHDYNILEATSIPYEDDPTDTSGTGYTSTGDETTGWLTIAASVPEEVEGTDVIVTITSDADTIQYRLYDINGLETTVSIPVGTYSVSSCYIVGDDTLVYQAGYNDSVTVTESGASALTINFYSDVEMNTIQDEAEDVTISEAEESTGLGKIQIILIVVGVVIVAGCGLAAIRIVRSNKE